MFVSNKIRFSHPILPYNGHIKKIGFARQYAKVLYTALEKSQNNELEYNRTGAGVDNTAYIFRRSGSNGVCVYVRIYGTPLFFSSNSRYNNCRMAITITGNQKVTDVK